MKIDELKAKVDEAGLLLGRTADEGGIIPLCSGPCSSSCSSGCANACSDKCTWGCVTGCTIFSSGK